MTPQQALDFFTHWTREALPLKHIDTYNQAFVTLSKLIADAQAKPADPQAPG